MVPVFGNLKRSGAPIPSVRETENFLLVLPYRQILAPAQFLPVCSHLPHMLASPRECEQGEKIMVSEEATPARYSRVLPRFTYSVKTDIAPCGSLD